VPTLFSSDPKGALARMKAFPELAHAAVQLLTANIFYFEALANPAEAVRFVKEPWTSKAASPLSREWLEQNDLPHKRPRTQQETLQSTGDNPG